MLSVPRARRLAAFTELIKQTVDNPLPDQNVQKCLSSVAAIALALVTREEFSARFKKPATTEFILRVMVGW